MIAPSSAFASYVELARTGKAELWRVVVGVVLVVLAWLVWTLAAFLSFASYSGAFDNLARRGAGESWPIVEEFFGSPTGLAAMLSSFLGIWVGVWLAVRLLHGRPFGSVLGAGGRLSWRNLFKGLGAALLVSALSEAAFYIADPSLSRSEIALGAWLIWLAPLTLLLFVQVSAEELAFRGYLLQSLAALHRSPIVWAGIPALAFTLLHWNASAGPAMNAAMLASIAAFALTATLLIYRTGELGAAMGVHLGINFFSILIVSRMTWLDGAALFTGRAVDSQGWSTGEAVWLAIVSVVMFPAILWLLLARRSPLRVASAQPAPTPVRSGASSVLEP